MESFQNSITPHADLRNGRLSSHECYFVVMLFNVRKKYKEENNKQVDACNDDLRGLQLDATLIVRSD